METIIRVVKEINPNSPTIVRANRRADRIERFMTRNYPVVGPEYVELDNRQDVKMDQPQNTYHITGINPEPWVSPEATVGRKGSKYFVQFYSSDGLKAYQQAVKEEIVQQNGHLMMYEGPLVVEFFFWRNTDNGEVEERKMVRNEADATNMQKACEDALQGILYNNDKHNRIVSSYIVDVGPKVPPHIAIRIEPFDPANWEVPEIPVSSAFASKKAWGLDEDDEPF